MSREHAPIDPPEWSGCRGCDHPECLDCHGLYDCDGCGQPTPVDRVMTVKSSMGETTQCESCRGHDPEEEPAEYVFVPMARQGRCERHGCTNIGVRVDCGLFFLCPPCAGYAP